MIDLRFGDCLDVLKTLPAGSVDAVVSDPPYGMRERTNRRRFTGGHRHPDRKNGRDWGKPISGDDRPFDPSPWLRFSKVILFGSNHFGQCLPVGTTLVWVKRNELAYGHFLSDAELAWMKGGHGVYLFKDLSMNCGGAGRIHPNQKPIPLMEWCIKRLRLKPGSTILDPYMGSGSTGQAAINLGFNFIGIECDADHFATASERLLKPSPARATA